MTAMKPPPPLPTFMMGPPEAVIPWCGRQTPVLMSGDARVHTGCKQRPSDVQTEWTTAKDLLITVRSALVGEGS